MIKFLFKEIDEDRKLHLFGVFLAITQIATYIFYVDQSKLISSQVQPICWPFFDNCEAYFRLLHMNIDFVLVTFIVLSFFSIVFFVSRKIFIACVCLFLASLVRFGLQISNYTYMGNYHYMNQIVILAFLFLPEKKRIIPLLIVMFYFFAGLIKFNNDWLTGSALLKPAFVTGVLLNVLLVYVIYLEIIGSLFLLKGKNKSLFFLFFVQFILFHAFSWHIVGFYYPIVMFCLISIFILDMEPFEFPKKKINQFVVGLFIISNLIPHLLDRDSSVTGQYRILSLNMLDAMTTCQTRFFIKYKKRTVEYSPSFENHAPRIFCDPLLVVRKSEKICDEFKNSSDFVDIDLDHQARRTSELKISQFSFTNICKNQVNISWLGVLSQKQNKNVESGTRM